MKNKMNYFAMLCAGAFSVFAMSCSDVVTNESAKEVANSIEGIEIAQDTIRLTLGQQNTASVNVTVTPNNDLAQYVTWGSTEPTVANIDAGVITAYADGIAKIIAYADNGKVSDTCVVVVDHVPTQSITINKHELTLNMGSYPSEELTATLTPANAGIVSINWTSMNPEIATVDASGIVTCVADGVATIMAENDGLVDSCHVTVEHTVVTEVKLNATELTLAEGQRDTLTAEVLPADAYYKDVVWSTSNPNIVSIAYGNIVAKQSGVATITATVTGDGVIGQCVVTVKPSENVDFKPYDGTEKWN